MRISKSFVDILFILLCSTIVLLSESIRIGAVDTAPARIGGGGISPIHADDVRVLIVHRDRLLFDEEPVHAPEDVVVRLEPGQRVLLVPGTEQVGHHRVMSVWSQLHEHGLRIQLGAQKAGRREREEG